MIYLFLTASAIYFVLVTACKASQREDVCFKGLRALVALLALVTFVDSMSGWNGSASEASQNILSYAQNGSFFRNSEKYPSSPKSDTTISRKVSGSTEAALEAGAGSATERVSSESRLRLRADNLLNHEPRTFSVVKTSAREDMLRSIPTDRPQLAVRTAMLGILLRRMGR